MYDEQKKVHSDKMIIRKCHKCGQLTESHKELEKCPKCQKGFLPLNYFGKVHRKNNQEFHDLFANSSELHEDDLIKGIYVLW